MPGARIAVCAAAVLGASQGPPAAAPTPASVGRDIAEHGAKAVVDAMWTAGSWDRVENGIASGSPAWIGLVPLLSTGTDAGTSEGLSLSLIRALPKAPEAVLAVIDASGRSYPRSPGQVCSAAFFEGDRTDVPRYRAQAIAAVTQVHTPALTAAKRACLARLRASAR